MTGDSQCPIVKFSNCLLLRDHQLVEDDLWICGSTIIDPEDLFYNQKRLFDQEIDCQGAIISPGFIDIQLNGGFGVDFSHDVDTAAQGVEAVAQGILAHGVTSFCPTIVTSAADVYEKVLPYLKKRSGGKHGAEVLGAHVEGPFINPEKRGAHQQCLILPIEKGLSTVQELYKRLDCIAIVTLAPELPNGLEAIDELSKKGIVVSVGHSMAQIKKGEEAVNHGAACITHLFNAMLPFHHRDPGLVGLLGSNRIPEGRVIYYGIIADGNHTHPATTRIAYRSYPQGIVLVTDACSAMGLSDGIYHIGPQTIQVSGTKAFVKGTQILAGSVATMVSCVQYFWKTTGCTLVEAIEAATLHPAKLMGIDKLKGSLAYGSDADIILLQPETLNVLSTWIAGQCVYKK